MYGRCLEGVLNVSGRCLKGVWKVSGRCLKGVSKLSEGVPKISFKHKILLDQNVLILDFLKSKAP